jgi:hypothetical protein
MVLIEAAIEAHAVEPGHPEVAQDGVVRAGRDFLQRLLAVLGRIDVVALHGQGLCHEHRHQRLVVNDQNAVAARLGGARVLGGHSTVSPGPLQARARPFQKPQKPRACEALPPIFFPKIVTRGDHGHFCHVVSPDPGG